MSEAVIVALITGAFAVLAQFILTHSANQKMLTEIEKRSEISDTKLEGQITAMKSVWDVRLASLTDAVNKHNGFAERIPVLEEKIKSLNERVTEIERSMHHD